MKPLKITFQNDAIQVETDDVNIQKYVLAAWARNAQDVTGDTIERTLHDVADVIGWVARRRL